MEQEIPPLTLAKLTDQVRFLAGCPKPKPPKSLTTHIRIQNGTRHLGNVTLRGVAGSPKVSQYGVHFHAPGVVRSAENQGRGF
jgi:hypothetical protein